MKQTLLKGFLCTIAAVICMEVINPVTVYAESDTGWKEEDGNWYWYENGIKQGTEGRGKEIYDPASDAWYWLDAKDNGKMAVSKDVYQESDAGAWGEYENAEGIRVGKWVRYDEKGHMVKGWDTNENGTYYFDYNYGTMAKGSVEIDGRWCYFDPDTGVGADNCWITIDGTEYWYEDGVRQGYLPYEEGYRGKEIYDPVGDAWVWLDNVQAGAKAISKDVYQESEAGAWGEYEGADGKRYGKWVRYDENGHMVKGWDTNENGTYFFDYTYGTMAKGIVEIDGITYRFHETTGVLEGIETELAWYVSKETRYNSSDKLIGESVYEYDDRGNRTKYTQYEGSSRRIAYQEEMRYDEKNRICWEKQYQYSNGSEYYLQEEIESTFEDGILSGRKQTVYKKSGAVVSKIETNCNAAGNVTQVSCYDAKDILTAVYIYTYDETGKLSVMREYDSNQTLLHTTVYTYDSASGKVSSYETKDEIEGYVTERSEYDYDNRGFCSEYRYYVRMLISTSGEEYQYELKLRNRNTYRYDEEGNYLQSDCYSYNEKGTERHTSSVVYTYEHLAEQQTVVKTYDSYYEHSVIDENGYFVYDKNGNVTYELGYNYGYENERDSKEVLAKQTFYVGNPETRYKKTLDYWVEYLNLPLPLAEQLRQGYVENPSSRAYYADGSLKYYIVREYVALGKNE